MLHSIRSLALSDSTQNSNVHVEVLKTSPRVAVTVGEKFFFRARNYLAITMLLIEEGDYDVGQGSSDWRRRGLLDLSSSSSKDYTLESLEDLCRIVITECQVLKEVEYLEATKSERLY